MTDHPIVLAVCAVLLSAAIVTLANSHHIHAWERTNGYPFGKMCHSAFTGYIDTCKH